MKRLALLPLAMLTLAGCSSEGVRGVAIPDDGLVMCDPIERLVSDRGCRDERVTVPRTAEDVAPTTTTAVTWPTTMEVLAAFKADGLPVGQTQYNTHAACQGEVPCQRVLEIRETRMSIWEFTNEQDARRWAAVYPWHYVNGSIMLRFTRDGLKPTPADTADGYARSLDRFMDGR